MPTLSQLNLIKKMPQNHFLSLNKNCKTPQVPSSAAYLQLGDGPVAKDLSQDSHRRPAVHDWNF